MIQDIFVIGATGKVGKTLIRQVIGKGDTNKNIHANPTRIIGLASSTHYLYSSKGLSPEQANGFVNKHYANARQYSSLNELSEVVHNNKNESSVVFVDVTALNEPMTDFHLHIIRNTSYGIVTANKNPVALSDYSIFQELTANPRRYKYSCSVMAGAQAVPFIQYRRDLNDKLMAVRGCFSGTNGYICSELEKNKKFSAIVKDALEKGYTEPHPRDDLNGLDVARKLVVLGRTAGYTVGIKEVKVEPFIPHEYFKENDVAKFLSNIKELDKGFEERIANLKSKGQTLRYVAQMSIDKGHPQLNVSLIEVQKQSPLGRLENTVNKIIIVSDAYPDGYSIEAPGAGLIVTASNIRQDLVDLLPERRVRD